MSCISTYHNCLIVKLNHLSMVGISLTHWGPRQNGRQFSDDVFKHIFLNEDYCILIEISFKFVSHGPFNTILSLVQIMAWHRSGNKHYLNHWWLNLMTHICITQPQWGKNDSVLTQYGKSTKINDFVTYFNLNLVMYQAVKLWTHFTL